MRKRTNAVMTAGCILVLALAGCVSGSRTAANRPGTRPTRYLPIDEPDPEHVSTGIESQDIVAMTERMARDMLASPRIVQSERPATVIVDAEYLVNDSSQRLNERLTADRLRVQLFRAADGRIRFQARHAEPMVRDEHALRADNLAGGHVRRTLPSAKYRLSGRFQNLPAAGPHGTRSNYVQVLFEMIDLDSGELVWTGMYEFKKSHREAIMYR